MFLAGIQDELVSGYPTKAFGYDKTGTRKFLTGQCYKEEGIIPQYKSLCPLYLCGKKFIFVESLISENNPEMSLIHIRGVLF